MSIRNFLQGLGALYSYNYPTFLVRMLRKYHFHTPRFVVKYWQTNNVAAVGDATHILTQNERYLRAAVAAGMLLQIGFGILELWIWQVYDVAGGLAFGVALLLSYPIVWAHGAVIVLWLHWLWKFVQNPKREGKLVLCNLLEDQVVRLRAKHSFTIVAVAGSVGKTSTKLAIAHVLSQQGNTIYQVGNYNDRLTVPLVLFDRTLPSLFNVVAWLRILLANERTIRQAKYPYRYAVLELGTDGSGQLKDFAYLVPEMSVVTALTPEHMEYFKTLDAVAAEELTVAEFSKQTLINADDSSTSYYKTMSVKTYGSSKDDDFVLVKSHLNLDLSGTDVMLDLGPKKRVEITAPILGKAGSKILLAASAVAAELGLKVEVIRSALASLPQAAGRMQVLAGKNDSLIIDDTYNASPAAVKAGLDVLYAAKASKRIAILGNMNEMGSYSKAAHKEVGDYCRPSKLSLVVTLGKDANKHLAKAAEAAGCEVISCTSPYEVGAIVHGRLTPGTVVLAEGSQNGVFAEEALKDLLASTEDQKKLVRQSAYWMRIKRRQFTSK